MFIINTKVQCSAIAYWWNVSPHFCQTLTWCKTPMGTGQGGVYCPTTEFLLLGRKGKMPKVERKHKTLNLVQTLIGYFVYTLLYNVYLIWKKKLKLQDVTTVVHFLETQWMVCNVTTLIGKIKVLMKI
jgi:hypothetical protein